MFSTFISIRKIFWDFREYVYLGLVVLLVKRRRLMEGRQKNMQELEFGGIRKLLWKYFLPAFAGVIINSLYNIVDRIFIGQGVGDYALAGLGSVFPIMLIVMGFGMLVGIGAGVRISLNLGKKDFNRAELVLGTALMLAIIIAVFVTVLGFVIKQPVLKLFGADDLTLKFANEYLGIILLSTVFGTVGFSLNNLIRSEGNAKIAMYSMIISAGLNLLLDPLFIFVFNLGVKGAAWATLISQFVLMLLVLKHFTSSYAVVKLRLANIRLNPQITWYIFGIGFSPFLMQIASSAVMGTFNVQLFKFGGDLAVGAMSIILSVTMLIFMTILALTMAAQPIVSFNYGAQNYTRVKKTFFTALWAATFVSCGGFLVVQLIPGQIVRLFNNESQELLQVGVEGMRIFMLAWGVVGFQIIVGSYFQWIGKVGTATFLSLLRQVVFLIPMLFILPRYFGLKGVWVAAPISDILSGLVVSVFLILEIKKINIKISTQANKPMDAQTN